LPEIQPRRHGIMSVKIPGVNELVRIARGLNLRLTTDDLESFRRLMEPTIAGFASPGFP
jgi:hypothetical protein